MCDRQKRSTITIDVCVGLSDVLMTLQPDTSSGCTRKSTLNEPDEDQEGHESKRLRLVGGLDVSVDTLDCVYLDVVVCGDIDAKTTHEIIAMTAEELLAPAECHHRGRELSAVESKPVARTRSCTARRAARSWIP